jgi:acylphosphatase
MTQDLEEFEGAIRLMMARLHSRMNSRESSCMSQPIDPPVRRRILYRGQVQGVGFRFTACQAAAGHEVAGFVRNLRNPSRQVEVVVEGRPGEIDAFLADLADRMAGYIDSTDVASAAAAATGEFTGFQVRY